MPQQYDVLRQLAGDPEEELDVNNPLLQDSQNQDDLSSEIEQLDADNNRKQYLEYLKRMQQPVTPPQEAQVVQPTSTPDSPLAAQDAPLSYQRATNDQMKSQHEIEKELYDQVKRGLMAQGAGIENLNALRNQAASVPTQVDISPLNAYVDSIVKDSKISSGYKRPESGQEKQDRIMKYEEAIQKAKTGLSTAQIAALKEQLNSGIYKQQAAAARGGLAQSRLGFQTDKEARSTLNNDQILKQYTPRLEGAAKIGELISAAQTGKVVRNQALLGQLNAEISRLETGSQSPGLHAGEKTELLDKAAQMGAFRDSITGSPQDAVRPEVINAAGKLVKELSGSYKKAIDSRIDFLKGGMSPSQQAIAEEKHNSIKKTYAPRLGGWDQEEAPGPETKTVGGRNFQKVNGGWQEVK